MADDAEMEMLGKLEKIKEIRLIDKNSHILLKLSLDLMLFCSC